MNLDWISPGTAGTSVGFLVAAFWGVRLRSLMRSRNAQVEGKNKELSRCAQETAGLRSELESSERRFRQLFEQSRDGLLVAEPSGKIIAANRRAIALCGNGLIDSTLFELFHQSDHSEVERALEGASREAAGLFEGQIQTADHALVPVEIHCSRIAWHAAPALLLQMRDIRKRSAAIEALKRERELSESLIRTANVFIASLDAEGRIDLFNETAERVTGFKREEVLGRNAFELFSPPGRFPETWAYFEEMVKSGSPTEMREARLLNRSGEELLFGWQTSELAGEPRRFILFGIDLTERRRAEEARLELERRMLDAQKLESLGLLAGGIAHDFNNLLTAILGNASLARMEIGSQSAAVEYLQEVERTAAHASDLCKQMLAYSGQGRREVRALDLNRLIEEMAQLLQVSVAKKVGLKLSLASKLPRIQGDTAQLRQIIMNLVINGSEAISGREGVVTLRTSVRTMEESYFHANELGDGLRGGDYVILEVADTGEGMSAETRAKVFDPFFTTKATGSGLGLASVLGIVRRHSGAVELESGEGTGTTFRIFLPAIAFQDTGNQEQSHPATDRSGAWQGDGLVLVVDDEEGVRLLSERVLRTFGFRVITAADGRQGLAHFLANASAISAVLLDSTMPQLSGEEVLKEIRKCSEVPVLLMSGYDVSNPAPESRVAFLKKPFKVEALREELRKLLDA